MKPRHIVVNDRVLSWRLAECMKAAGIASARDLYEKIKTIKPESLDYSYSSVARMISQPPARLNLRMLVILTIVLRCSVTDILDVGPDQQLKRS